MYSVYVLRSKTSGKIYIGQTNNIEERLSRHNKELPSRKKSYTYKNQGPWEIIYKEVFDSRLQALKRERYLKSHHGRDWLKSFLGP